jgi:hypothetical protein
MAAELVKVSFSFIVESIRNNKNALSSSGVPLGEAKQSKIREKTFRGARERQRNQ